MEVVECWFQEPSNWHRRGLAAYVQIYLEEADGGLKVCVCGGGVAWPLILKWDSGRTTICQIPLKRKRLQVLIPQPTSDIYTDFRRWQRESKADATGRIHLNKMLKAQSQKCDHVVWRVTENSIKTATPWRQRGGEGGAALPCSHWGMMAVRWRASE